MKRKKLIKSKTKEVNTDMALPKLDELKDFGLWFVIIIGVLLILSKVLNLTISLSL